MNPLRRVNVFFLLFLFLLFIYTYMTQLLRLLSFLNCITYILSKIHERLMWFFGSGSSIWGNEEEYISLNSIWHRLQGSISIYLQVSFVRRHSICRCLTVVMLLQEVHFRCSFMFSQCLWVLGIRCDVWTILCLLIMVWCLCENDTSCTHRRVVKHIIIIGIYSDIILGPILWSRSTLIHGETV